MDKEKVVVATLHPPKGAKAIDYDPGEDFLDVEALVAVVVVTHHEEDKDGIFECRTQVRYVMACGEYADVVWFSEAEMWQVVRFYDRTGEVETQYLTVEDYKADVRKEFFERHPELKPKAGADMV